ncbi:MAG: sugar phosphate isomerase/epimerase [Planctomycetes bacterium]|nr:sugar phosphate isomerase/epimerase [Planctomycetota bacterium]
MPHSQRPEIRLAQPAGAHLRHRISVSQLTTFHWSLLEDVVGFHDAGFTNIGLWRRKLCDFGEERGVDLIRDSGLNVTSFSHAGGFTGSDGLSFDDALDDARDALHWAAELQADCLVVIAGARNNHTQRHVRRILVDALRELGNAGAERGVQIALQFSEGAPGNRWSFLDTLKSAGDLLDLCDHPYVGMVFDMFHMCRERELRRRIAEFAPLIKLTTVADARIASTSDDDRCLPGQGILPLSEIMRALEASGYTGAYDLQLTNQTCRLTDYAALLSDCRRALEGMIPGFLTSGSEPYPR